MVTMELELAGYPQSILVRCRLNNMFFSSGFGYKCLGICFLVMFIFICMAYQNIGLDFKYYEYSIKTSAIVKANADLVHVIRVDNEGEELTKEVSSPQYYVNNIQCKIPYIDPFDDEVMEIYKPKKFETCTNESDLVRPIFDMNSKRYVLHINSSVISQMLNSSEIKYTCYYQEITHDDNNGLQFM